MWHWLGCVGVKPKPLEGLTGVCSDIFIVLPWRFGHVGCVSAAAFSLLGLGTLATGGGLTVWQQGLFGCGFCWRLASMSLCSGRGSRLDGLTDWMAGGCGVRFAAFRNVPFQAAKRHVSHVNTCRFGVPNGRYAASTLGWRLVVVSFFLRAQWCQPSVGTGCALPFSHGVGLAMSVAGAHCPGGARWAFVA